MERTPVNPATVPEAAGGYVNGLQVSGFARLLFISGQIPQTPAGDVPADFEKQCRLAWSNVVAVLTGAGMGVENLVKVTTFLSDRDHASANTLVRQEFLGGHEPALTVVVTGIWDPTWFIEIEAVAAA
ncbi:MAG: RidA family protein [Nocardioidaceae bacterium]